MVVYIKFQFKTFLKNPGPDSVTDEFYQISKNQSVEILHKLPKKCKKENFFSILWGQGCSDTKCHKIMLPLSPKFTYQISMTYSKHKLLDLTLKAHSVKSLICLILAKKKVLVLQETPIKKKQRQPTGWEKIFMKHTDKKQVTKI